MSDRPLGTGQSDGRVRTEPWKKRKSGTLRPEGKQRHRGEGWHLCRACCSRPVLQKPALNEAVQS